MHFKRLFCILLAAIFLLIATGCNGNSTADAVIGFEINSEIKNIDPQLAITPSELLVVRNTFEGLFRFDSEGALVPAAAKSYTISDDRLTYTFNLNEELVWSDGSPLKAHDFEFGVKRAVDPVINSPQAYLLSCLKNADEIMAGNQSPDRLGIKVLDDYTLQIELKKPNSNFLELLTNPVFMPCNRQFFEKCAGKYGLGAKTILSNGSFYVRGWNAETGNIRLNRNGEYNGKFKALPLAVEVVTKGQVSTLTDRLISNDIDIAEMDYSLVSQARQKNLKTIDLYDTCYCLLINPNSNIGSDLMREAFGSSIHRNAYTNEMPSFFKRADLHIPPDLKIASHKVSDTLKFVYPVDYEPANARNLFLNAISKLPNKKFPSTTLLCVDDLSVKSVATSIVQRWQQDLGAYINIDVVDINSMKSRAAAGNYQLALYPVSSTDDSAVTFLKKFVSNSPNNFWGFSNPQFDELVGTLDTTTDEDELIQTVTQAQQLLFESNEIIPIFFSPRIFIASENVVDLKPDLKSGNIDFAFVGKKTTVR